MRYAAHRPPTFPPKILAILTAVSEDCYLVSVNEIWSTSKQERFTTARQISCFLLHEIFHFHLWHIADIVGYVDHGSVSYSLSAVADRMSTDRAFRERVEKLLRVCSPPTNVVTVEELRRAVR